MNELFASFKSVAGEEKKAVGIALNELEVYFFQVGGISEPDSQSEHQQASELP